jgi:hypothetical protein
MSTLGTIEAIAIGLLCSVLFSGTLIGLFLRSRRQMMDRARRGHDDRR